MLRFDLNYFAAQYNELALIDQQKGSNSRQLFIMLYLRACTGVSIMMANNNPLDIDKTHLPYESGANKVILDTQFILFYIANVILADNQTAEDKKKKRDSFQHVLTERLFHRESIPNCAAQLALEEFRQQARDIFFQIEFDGGNLYAQLQAYNALIIKTRLNSNIQPLLVNQDRTTTILDILIENVEGAHNEKEKHALIIEIATTFKQNQLKRFSECLQRTPDRAARQKLMRQQGAIVTKIERATAITLELRNYSMIRKTEDGDYAWYDFFRQGYSKKTKVDAVDVLIQYLNGDIPEFEHMPVISNGRIGKTLRGMAKAYNYSSVTQMMDELKLPSRLDRASVTSQSNP